MAALGAAWSASLVRTSLYLGVLSAAGVALGFASGSDITGGSFVMLAAGVAHAPVPGRGDLHATGAQGQRGSVVHITGLNRIQRFLADGAPGALPLLVLPVHDDQAALYRSVGTGMHRRPPRHPIRNLVAQTQGIVTGVLAASFVGLAVAARSAHVARVPAAVVFVLTVVILFVCWQRSLAEIQAAIVPRYPTPPEDVGARSDLRRGHEPGLAARYRPCTVNDAIGWFPSPG